MWELIRANRRKSFWLFIFMGIILLSLGYFIGVYLASERGGIYGALIALGIWGMLSLISFLSGSRILLLMSNAKEVNPDVHPALFNVVEEMKLAAGLPAMPKVYIINEEAPNAFATGYRPENSAIAVTSGLLARLNRDELQGVVAHETAHIFNRDVQFMTIAGIMLGSIVLISRVFLRGMFYSGGKRYSSGGKGSGQAQLILLAIAVVFAILAPIFAQILYFAISRKREYLADATAVRFTRLPEGLASALEKISQNTAELTVANKVTAGMYIINPLKQSERKMSDLSSTHPPISERIKILRSIAGGAGYVQYQLAYQEVKGVKSKIIPTSGLNETEVNDLKTSTSDNKTQKTVKENKRILGDLMMTVSSYMFLSCSCGLKIKVPPDFKKPAVECPRCGHQNLVVKLKNV